MTAESAPWPAFPVAGWIETQPTLHRWSQIVGKVRTALSPPLNHFWHSTLYVSSRGLTTSPIPYRSEFFDITFDFVDHQLAITPSWTTAWSMPLRAQSVAAFYAEFTSALRDLEIDVHIWPKPVEIADRTPFGRDTEHASYDPAAVHAFWRVLLQTHRVFAQFRGRFLGKCSPVHFFWGGFDLAVTRFSGRRAPEYTGASPYVHPHVMHESYSHEVSSAGFWAGADAPPMFYSYAVPTPELFRAARVSPADATFNDSLGEFVLPYDAIRTSAHPDDDLLNFLESTYAAAADLGHWDRELLEQRAACACTPAELARFEGERRHAVSR